MVEKNSSFVKHLVRKALHIETRFLRSPKVTGIDSNTNSDIWKNKRQESVVERLLRFANNVNSMII